MEEPSANHQVALASLAFLIVGFVFMIWALFSGIVDLADIPAGFTAVTLPGLIVALAFFTLSLMWWRHWLGFVFGIVVGILAIINLSLASVDSATGNTPSAALILTIPGIVFALILIVTSYLSWRE